MTADPPLAGIADAAGEPLGPGGLHGGGVVWMVTRQALRPARTDGAVIGAELRVEVGRLAVADPHRPDKERQALREAPIAHVAAADGILHPAHLGDVDENADQTRDRTARIGLSHAAHHHVAQGRVRPQDPRLVGEGAAGGEGLPHQRPHAVAVVGW